MNRKKTLILLVLLAASAAPTNTFAQERPRVAVLPFNPVGVSEAEAQVLTSLFETAMVNTRVFEVIEQSQAGSILDAQEYSLSGCTDEACAVEIGKLLAAENIVLGSVSRLGKKFIVTAKIIDVSTGQNIRADSVEGMAIEDMTEQVNVLAAKLADVQPRAEGAEAVERKAEGILGELFVSTDPEGATIFIDGAEKGTSPSLISGIQAGTVVVEARKGDRYGQKEVDVLPEQLVEVALTLHAAAGRIFIETEEKDLEVFLDGRSLGPVGEGLFKDISVGSHEIELRGKGRYWKGSAEVEIGKTTQVKAEPVGIGRVAFELPEEATAVVNGPMFETKLTGEGEEQVPEGRYDVIVSGKYYKTLKTSLSVRAGIKTDFKPDLEFAATDEAAEYLAERRIRELEEKRRELKREIRGLRGRGGLRTLGWITGGTAAAGLATSVVFTILGITAKKAYNEATDSFTAVDRREAVERWNLGLYISGGATIALGAATPLFLLLPGKKTPEDDAKREALIKELSAVEAEIEALKKDPRGGLK